jgi:hypothetical protein
MRNTKMKNMNISLIVFAGSVVCGVMFNLLFHQNAEAQYKVPFSVIGSGGGVLTSSSYRIVGTLGQPTAGITSSPSNNSYFGFWYLPTTIITDVERMPGNLPTEYRLEQNYPNPFNPATTIQFALPQRSSIVLKVFDMLGREVTTLVDGELDPGEYRVVFDASGLPSGVYVYRIHAEGFSQSKKLLLLR